MEKANLPNGKACEPTEEARQDLKDIMTPRVDRQPARKLLSFADDNDTAEDKSSQRSSNYKEVLSQPAPGLSHRQRLLWLQKRRTAGLWAQCDDCNKWRFLPDVLDRYELPMKWFCHMNKDAAYSDCSVPEAPIRVREEEDLIHGEYSVGSVVLARLPGWPWWPAMVDDCPDAEQFYWLDGFSDIPTHYNVVFFDSSDVTRAWISPENLKPYAPYKNSFIQQLNEKSFKKRIRAAATQADDATKLSLVDRLQKYSFLVRYKGIVSSPKKVSKKELSKHLKSLKRRFHVAFEASDSDTDDEVLQPGPLAKNKNVIVLGTPKKSRMGTGVKRTPKTNDNGNADKNVDGPANEKPASAHGKRTENDISKNIVNSLSKADRKADSQPASENVAKTDTDLTNASTIDVFKRPNSLAVQMGSTNTNAAEGEESFDNDTSKTYVPENETPQSTASEAAVPEFSGFQVRIASPSSDDFDF